MTTIARQVRELYSRAEHALTKELAWHCLNAALAMELVSGGRVVWA